MLLGVLGCFVILLSYVYKAEKNKSGVISVHVIDKSSGKYKVFKTIGSSSIPSEVEALLKKVKEFIQRVTGLQQFDFSNTNGIIQEGCLTFVKYKVLQSA